MDARNLDRLAAQAELYLCLARAFLAPRDPALAAAMRDALADDLEALAAELELDVAAPLADYRAEMARVGDAAPLLQAYSAIFLAPPTAASINVAKYLDGAINGGSVRAMEEAYRHCGLQRDEGFRDLSDHVSVQLEFVAWLYAARARPAAATADGAPAAVEPGRFLHDFALRWIEPLCADLRQAAATEQLGANPYLPLACILRQAIRADAVAPEPDAAAARRSGALDKARARYAGRGITAEDIAEMKRKLEARGLSTDHLPVADDEPAPASRAGAPTHRHAG